MERFKVFDSGDIFKGLTKTTSSVKAAYGGAAISGTADQMLTWYLIDRQTSLYNTDDLKNLFFSLGLARENSGGTWSISPDWIDLYRGEKLLVATIPQSACSSYIDGSTLELRVPTGTTSTDYVTFFGSSYRGHLDANTNFQISESWDDGPYGSATIYLFPNSVTFGTDEYGAHPFTGSVGGQPNPNSGASTWTAANTTNVSMYPHLRATHWGRNPDGGRDVPYGVAFLEKGIFVIFDTPGRRSFVNYYLSATTLWASVGTNFAAVTITGGTEAPNTNAANRNGIRFTGANAYISAKLTYRTITTAYKLVYFCHAGQNEFNSTINHTYDQKKAFYRPEEADTIYITEVGLYDDSNALVAYGKLSEPVAKNMLETITLKVEINL